MPELTIRTATPQDLPALETLLTTAHLPLDGVRDHLPTFLLAFTEQQLVGSAGVERHGHTGLLRSVAVHPDLRGSGLGTQLTHAIIDRARQQHLTHVVLLTTTAHNYFPRFGFTRIDRAHLPPEVHASRELQGACPASAVAMHLDLTRART